MSGHVRPHLTGGGHSWARASDRCREIMMRRLCFVAADPHCFGASIRRHCRSRPGMRGKALFGPTAGERDESALSLSGPGARDSPIAGLLLRGVEPGRCVGNVTARGSGGDPSDRLAGTYGRFTPEAAAVLWWPLRVESGSPASLLELVTRQHRGCTGETGHARRRGGINGSVA